MLFVKSSQRGKYHDMYHRSRTNPQRGVANCGHTGMIVAGFQVDNYNRCKKCRKGPLARIVKLFDGIRVAK